MNPISIFEEEKYMQIKKHIKAMKPGDSISIAYIQRKIRVGYEMGKRLLKGLHKEGYVEDYQTWVGSTINGVRKDGHEITLYRISTMKGE